MNPSALRGRRHRDPKSVFRPELETTLVDVLCEQIPRFLGRDWAPFRREVVVGSIIADLVLHARRRGKPLFASPLSVGESVLLSVVRQRGPMRLDELRSLGSPARPVDADLHRLMRAGLLKKSPDDHVAVARAWLTVPTVVAIEAKLSRWRDALAQATRYCAFADESYVALPEGHIQRAELAASEFRAAGVGLLSVSNVGVTRVVCAPRSTRHDWRREFVYSRIASQIEA